MFDDDGCLPIVKGLWHEAFSVSVCTLLPGDFDNRTSALGVLPGFTRPSAQTSEKPTRFDPGSNGGLGTRGKGASRRLYARVSMRDQQTLPMQMSAMRD